MSFIKKMRDFKFFKNESIDNQEKQTLSVVKDGWISLHDGHFTITNPTGNGKYPIINIPEHPNVHIYINGEKAIGEHVVQESSKIDVITNDIPFIRSLSHRVSNNKMIVFVKVSITPGVVYSFRNSFQKSVLNLEILEKKDDVPSLPRQMIEKILIDHQFIGHLEHSNMMKLSHAKESIELPVFYAVSPQLIKPTFAFDVKSTKQVSKGATLVHLDKNIHRIGRRNVYGEPVGVKELLPFSLGNGALLINDKIVSRHDGRLSFRNQSIDVIPVLHVNEGEQNDKQIVFDGDIIIHGNVLNADVKANGSIYIYGNVYQSVIESEEKVFISGKVTSSEVFCGREYESFQSIISTIKDYYPTFIQFLKEYDALCHAIKMDFRTQHKLELVVKTLFEKRFHHLLEYFEKITKLSISHSPVFQSFFLTHENIWAKQSLTDVSRFDIESYLFEMKKTIELDEKLPKIIPIITIKVSANSKIHSFGVCRITKSFHSGCIFAQDIIKIQEISGFGKENHLQIANKNGIFSVSKIQLEDDVSLQLGDTTHTISQKENVLLKGKE
jgi:hypothetical protein